MSTMYEFNYEIYRESDKTKTILIKNIMEYSEPIVLFKALTDFHPHRMVLFSKTSRNNIFMLELEKS